VLLRARAAAARFTHTTQLLAFEPLLHTQQPLMTKIPLSHNNKHNYKAGDWLQGPYVYRLYEHYDYGVRDIGRLFIVGFGSSALFGTCAGALCDK
jgi:hypothetical protein